MGGSGRLADKANNSEDARLFPRAARSRAGADRPPGALGARKDRAMPQPSFPPWLHLAALASLALACACAVFIVFDEMRRPQKMWIMNLVWPLTALFGSVLWLAGYLRWGRAPLRGSEPPGGETPMPVAVAKAATHCGAGCTLGDLIAETVALAVPAVAVAFGWGSVFSRRMFAVWIPDFILAFGLGVVFQYFTIQPMRKLSPGAGIVQAVKADTASITAWQVGMYGAMAVIQLLWFAPLYGGVADAAAPEFWLAMQAAMLCGFATSYPVNWLLVRAGVKERM